MKNYSLQKMYFDFDINFKNVCRQVHGKYWKFVLLSFDPVLVQCVAADTTSEPVASDFCLEHGGSIFLQSLVSLLPSQTCCHYSGAHCCGRLQSAVKSSNFLVCACGPNYMVTSWQVTWYHHCTWTQYCIMSNGFLFLYLISAVTGFDENAKPSLNFTCWY
jgi:hypothetical protein